MEKRPRSFEERRRHLAEQQRHLEQQRRRLAEELAQSGNAEAAKRAEPPVWRMEEEPLPVRGPEPTPTRRRHLAQQRRRDMIIFIGCFVLLLVVVCIVLWVAYVRNSLPTNGS